MSILNRTLTTVFGLLFWPFQKLDPIWALVCFSIATGVVMLWVFGKVSNQKAIEHVRNRTRGNLLAIMLYQHDLKVVVRLHGLILRDTLIYLRHTLVPMLVLMVPLIPMLSQLNLFFAFRPLQPGETAVVKMKLETPETTTAGVNLVGGEAVKVETPGVRIPSEGEIAWRVRTEQAGTHQLSFHVGQHLVHKDVRVGGGWGPVSSLRTGNWLDLLLYPGEAPLDAGSVRAIEVRYQPLPLMVLGWNVHWLVLFFVLSIASSFAFKGALGVEL
jgi:hypothetical protein